MDSINCSRMPETGGASGLFGRHPGATGEDSGETDRVLERL